jgi:hypothetical protein
MSDSKFIVGEAVEFIPGRWEANIPPGRYTVTRVMPPDHQARTYRVRSSDGQERVMSELQLRSAESV